MKGTWDPARIHTSFLISTDCKPKGPGANDDQFPAVLPYLLLMHVFSSMALTPRQVVSKIKPSSRNAATKIPAIQHYDPGVLICAILASSSHRSGTVKLLVLITVLAEEPNHYLTPTRCNVILTSEIISPGRRILSHAIFSSRNACHLLKTYSPLIIRLLHYGKLFGETMVSSLDHKHQAGDALQASSR